VQVPAVPASEIVVVSDSSVCAAAADAYNREAHRLFGTPPRERRVYVVRLGNGAYAIKDPTERGGEWAGVVLVNTAFEYLGNWAG
jgi:hypothetical protein